MAEYISCMYIVYVYRVQLSRFNNFLAENSKKLDSSKVNLTKYANFSELKIESKKKNVIVEVYETES